MSESASVYDAYWAWPNRRLDLNYDEVGQEELEELDRAVVDLGIEVETEGLHGFDEASKEARKAVVRTCKWWLDSGDAEARRLWAHTWHRQMARIDRWSGGGGGSIAFVDRAGLSLDEWTKSGWDAYSAVLYTNWCDVWEGQRMLVNFLVRAGGWVSDGERAKSNGVSLGDFAYVDDKTLKSCRLGFEFVLSHSFGAMREYERQGKAGLYVGDWATRFGEGGVMSGGRSSWAEINAFCASAGRLEETCLRLVARSSSKQMRRVCNSLHVAIDNLWRGRFMAVRDVSGDLAAAYRGA